MTSRQSLFLNSNRDALVIAGLAVLVFAIYGQTIGFQYINLDDNNYVYENRQVMSGINWDVIKWAFTSFHAGNWHPVTWVSLALDVQLFGAKPGMHHAVNVVLHFLNAVLAFWVFRRMTDAFWASAVVAAWFAVHPMHVESVAWITERKDLLSTLFWLLAIWFYVQWTDQGEQKSTVLYSASLGMFVLGLMSKPMIITLPFVLLLCDIWPLGRTGEPKAKNYVRLFVEKAPFFALSFFSALITLAAQRSVSAVESLSALPLGVRTQNAIVSYAGYFLSAFYPAGLAVWYPYDKDLNFAEVVGGALLLIAVTAICIWQFGRRKYLLVGWLWFIVTLLPVIGIIQVGGQAMADRYTYIPYFGLFLMVAFGVADLYPYLRLDKRLLAAGAGCSIAALAVAAYVQTGYWRNDETLYARTLAVTGNNFLIAQNYCHALMMQNRLDEAERLCNDSLDDRPNYFEALNTLGIISFKRGDYAAAEARFKSAVDSGKSHPLTYSNLALAQIVQGKPAEAEINLQKAVESSGPETSPTVFAETLSALVDSYLTQGNYERAVPNLKRLRFLQPSNGAVRLKLVEALIKLRQYPEAEAEAENILKADQNNAAAWNSLGLILLGTGDRKGAQEAFQKAVALRPEYEQAKENLRQVSQ